MNLGLSGRLTRATIGSPLTPLFLLASLVVGLPVAYVVEMALYWSLYDGPRARRIGAVLAAAGATLVVALMLFLHRVSGPTELCPAGMPTWWPGWVPHLS